MSNNKQMNMREGDIEDDSIYEQEFDETYDVSDCSYNDGENDLSEYDYESGYGSDSAETSSGMKNTPCPVSVPKLSQLAASTCTCKKCVSFGGEKKECMQRFTTYDDVKKFHQEDQRRRFAAIEAETDRAIAAIRAEYQAKWDAEDAEEKKWALIMSMLPREPKAVTARREAAKRALIKKNMDEARANRKRRPGGGDRPLGSMGRVIDADVIKARKALKRKENRDTNKREENIRSENFARQTERNVIVITPVIKLEPQQDDTVKTEEQIAAENELKELKEHQETVRRQILEIQLAKFEDDKIKEEAKKNKEREDEERKKREEEERKLEEEERKEEEKYMKALITARSAPVKKVWDNVKEQVKQEVKQVVKVEEVRSRVMCRSFGSGQKCLHGVNCRFSHQAPSQPSPVVKSNVMCRSISLGQKCFHGVNCRFSHQAPSVERPVMVCTQTKPTLAEICKRGFCVLTTDSAPVASAAPLASLDKIRGDAFVVLTDDKKMRDKLSLTKMCNSVGSGKPCRHSNCRFAHDVKELKIGECFFGEKCNHVCLRNGKYENLRNKNCMNMHPNETEYDFNLRTQTKRPVSMVSYGGGGGQVHTDQQLNIRHINLREQAGGSEAADGWQVKKSK